MMGWYAAVSLLLSLPLVVADSDLEANIEHAIRAVEATLKSHALDVPSVEEDAMRRLETMQSHMDRGIELRAKLDAEATTWNQQQIENLVFRLKEISAAEQERRETDKNTSHAQAIDEAATLSKDESAAELNSSILSWIEEEIMTVDFGALAASPPTPCTTDNEAAEHLHKAISNYRLQGIGIPDLLQLPGTKIVHELTSETYNPPSSTILGDYSTFIPEDWITWLPDGWKQWGIPNSLVPDHIWHSLGMSGSTTAPPEAILQDSSVPGSCWASPRPRVTIQLAAPAVVTAVSIDHVSSQVLKDRSSAPKKIRIVGYAPCTKDCRGLTFDPKTETFFADVQYDVASVSSIQTFQIPSSPQQHGDGSCSTTIPQCEAPDLFTAAVFVEVSENWGKPDYTCLYRVRVHGEQIH